MENITQFTNNLDISEDKESVPEIIVNDKEVTFNENISDDITDDYQYTRRKLIYMIEASEAVLKHAISDMSGNPGPRPIEAFSSLIKVLNDTTDRLFSIHEKMKKINPKEEKTTTTDDKTTMKMTVNDVIDAMDGN